jgi:ABC-type tungstate transport system substrate-binding protein
MAIIGALAGTALVFRRSTERLGRALLAVPIVVAVAATFLDT